MPSKKSEINEIASRIIALSALYSSNREFLEKCGITNHSLITDLKKKRIQNPGADILAKVVRGTGCSGSWLLTGYGSMFEMESDYVEEAGVNYVMIKGAINLIEEFEKRIEETNDNELSNDLEVKLGKLLVRIMERRRIKN
jgi:hypothetical protein